MSDFFPLDEVHDFLNANDGKIETSFGRYEIRFAAHPTLLIEIWGDQHHNSHTARVEHEEIVTARRTYPNPKRPVAYTVREFIREIAKLGLNNWVRELGIAPSSELG